MTKSAMDSVVTKLKFAEQEGAAQTVAKHLGLEYIHLIKYPILPEVLRLISEQEAVDYNMIAYLKAGGVVKVAISTPPTSEHISFLQNLSSRINTTIKLSFCSKISYDYALNLYLAFKEVDAKKKEEVRVASGDDYTSAIKSVKDINEQLKKVSTTELINLILAGALVVDASDVHLEPTEANTRLRFRIDGILQDVGELTTQQFHSVQSRIKNAARMKLDVIGAPQDGSFEHKVSGHKLDIRVSTLPASFGEDIVMRILRGDVKFLDLDELSFNPRMLDLTKSAIAQPHGMILNTGPTGSGKTTTLYAILSSLNSPEKKVITIEDPVEYRLSGINQIQVNSAAKLTFPAALHSALRQDPDIIMIGEIRDSETAQIALQAALTGHLVLTTLHANSAPAAIPRLLEMGIEPYLLAGSINLIISQRLVRKICYQCHGKDSACKVCAGTKYKGRIPLVEALSPSEEFNELIGRKATIAEFEKKAREIGMESILEDGMAKVAAGLTTQEEVDRVAREMKTQ